MNTKQIGDYGEQLAKKYLKDCGYKLRECNIRLCKVEVDIIAEKQNTIVFVEVKTRNNTNFGRPSEAVDIFKQKRYVMAANAYLAQERLADWDFRFDVIEVLDGEINHIIAAFM